MNTYVPRFQPRNYHLSIILLLKGNHCFDIYHRFLLLTSKLHITDFLSVKIIFVIIHVVKKSIDSYCWIVKQ